MDTNKRDSSELQGALLQHPAASDLEAASDAASAAQLQAGSPAEGSRARRRQPILDGTSRVQPWERHHERHKRKLPFCQFGLWCLALAAVIVMLVQDTLAIRRHTEAIEQLQVATGTEGHHAPADGLLANLQRELNSTMLAVHTMQADVQTLWACAGLECANGGLCALEVDGAACRCAGGYTGERCQYDPQCSAPYQTLNQPWRGIDYKPAGHKPDDEPVSLTNNDVALDDAVCKVANTCPSPSPPLIPACVATGVGGDRWYRFSGPGGNSLALIFTTAETGEFVTMPSNPNCGTRSGGWLSGWEGTAHDPDLWAGPYYGGTGGYGGGLGYTEQGHLPTAVDGVVNRSVCFPRREPTGPDHLSETCALSAAVGVVRCHGFVLFRLPYIEQLPGVVKDPCGNTNDPYVDHAYCTAHVDLDEE
jgi:hypothetical protein